MEKDELLEDIKSIHIGKESSPIRLVYTFFYLRSWQLFWGKEGL